jgi:hypothetical protein
MSRAIESLSVGAAIHWPGSQGHLVAVYECLAAKRRGGLGAAIKITALLRNPSERAALLAGLRREVEHLAASRCGPKANRHAAAVAGLNALDILACEDVP